MAVTSIAGYNYDPNIARRKIGSVGAGGEQFEEAIQTPVIPLAAAQQVTPLITPTPSSATQPNITALTSSTPTSVFDRYKTRDRGAAPTATFGEIIGGPFDTRPIEERTIQPIDDELIEDEIEFNNRFGAVDLDFDPSGRTDPDSPNYDPSAVASVALGELYSTANLTASDVIALAESKDISLADMKNSYNNQLKEDSKLFGPVNFISNLFDKGLAKAGTGFVRSTNDQVSNAIDQAIVEVIGATPVGASKISPREEASAALTGFTPPSGPSVSNLPEDPGQFEGGGGFSSDVGGSQAPSGTDAATGLDAFIPDIESFFGKDGGKVPSFMSMKG